MEAQLVWACTGNAAKVLYNQKVYKYLPRVLLVRDAQDTIVCDVKWFGTIHTVVIARLYSILSQAPGTVI